MNDPRHPVPLAPISERVRALEEALSVKQLVPEGFLEDTAARTELDLPENVALRVWDTSGETRYMVLPLRPTGTEGWSEERLASIVTRGSMIGIARVEVR